MIAKWCSSCRRLKLALKKTGNKAWEDVLRERGKDMV